MDHGFSASQLLHDAPFETASQRLEEAISNPEYMLTHWVNLPTSPSSHPGIVRQLSLREAILLALRYNPNIQNAELDRIVQRYQLRLAQNEFELQYALAGSAQMDNSRYSGVGRAVTRTVLGTPELGLKTKFGTQIALAMDNNVAPVGNYNPLVGFTIKQPLLRGFGAAANESGLLDALDNEILNKLNLQQSVIDQVTQVITAYRSLVLSGNNLQNQKRQLKDAKISFEINQKKIAAGLLEPTANVQQSYQIESLNLMVEQAENDFLTTTQDLLQTIGLDPDLRLAVPSDVSLEKITLPDTGGAIHLAELHNAQFLALKMVIRADERAYELAKNQQLWQLDASASVQAGTMTGVDSQLTGFRGIYNGNNVTEAAGITLTIPLHDLNRRQQLVTAKVRLEKDRLNLIAARRALVTLIKNTISSINSQAKRYELAKRQVDLAEKSYGLEKKKQQAGIASALDVNNTQNQLIQAQTGLISAKISYLNQMSSLQRVVGTTLQQWNITLRYGA
ncbi:MAG: TolC family protein [Legionellales bacterium]|nr:TolC family protein [Legionellales bacterium]